jgi:predicted AAA+ superfamily ATPase
VTLGVAISIPLANCKSIYNHQIMIPRRVTEVVRERLKAYPAVSVVGPRQAGKTTLAKSLGGEYYDLELEADRLRLDVEWPALADSEKLVVLDEAQAWPEVFPRLRSTIDEDRRRDGRFLLLGSVSPSLMEQVSESLAGRLSVVELTPFLMVELEDVAIDRLWLRGGYPDGGVLGTKRFPQWQRDYLELLTQRDLPNWGLPARPAVTRRLIAMIAAVDGQLWNASQIGKSLGLSHPTVNTYLDYLEGAFLLRRLPAFRANVRKRLTKSPKCFWRDRGLLHSLMNVDSRSDLLRSPWVGTSWEGFAIEQIIGTLRANDRTFEPYYLRTSDQREVDLVLDFGRKRWAIEIKLTSNPTPRDMQRLNDTADMIDATRRILVSRTTLSASKGEVSSLSLKELLNELS